MKKIKVVIIIAILILLTAGVLVLFGLNARSKELELKPIKSKSDLNRVLGEEESFSMIKDILTLPFSFLFYSSGNSYSNDGIFKNSSEGSTDRAPITNPAEGSLNKAEADSGPTDYSTTNIQVENVDEADIVKTDGEYIYSISENIIIITKASSDGKISIASELVATGIPQDILINQNKLIVISAHIGQNVKNYNREYNTIIEIYNVKDKANIIKLKEIKLDKKYYTSRMIKNKMYVLTSGYIYKEKDKDVVLPIYSIDNKISEISYNKINYMEGNKTKKISMIASIDLDDLEEGIDISGYLMPIDDVYISEKNMYLSFEKRENISSELNLYKLFTLKGIPGFIKETQTFDSHSFKIHTTIVKFEFVDKGIEYISKAKEFGNILNQFSMDEYGGNLRVTLNDTNKSNKLVVFSKEMKKIGEISNIAPGEKIYSTRFIKDRAYMVTYKIIDPLFVIDLADPTEPKILGELKIPGYSTYLHPYDENHIIGIGNDTTEETEKDVFGRIISQRSYVTGMKMSLFDINDVKNPKEKFTQKIGDRTSYSSILENHKALLFSKEKELIAIPINKYTTKISIKTSEDISSNINMINKIKDDPIKNGYIVYNINLKEGFKEKGVITHDTRDSKNNYWYSKNNTVRGIYIDNMLYTISEKFIKVNSLDNLQEKFSIEIGGEK